MTDLNELLTGFTSGLAGMAKDFKDSPLEAARQASTRSAEALKALKEPVRTVARSGVKLTAISQGTAASLIELQTEIVTRALTQAAARLERATHTSTMAELMQEQAEALKAASEQMVADAQRAVQILREAGEGIGKIATDTYAHVTQPEAAPAAGKRKAGPARRARKTAH